MEFKPLIHRAHPHLILHLKVLWLSALVSLLRTDRRGTVTQPPQFSVWSITHVGGELIKTENSNGEHGRNIRTGERGKCLSGERKWKMLRYKPNGRLRNMWAIRPHVPTSQHCTGRLAPVQTGNTRHHNVTVRIFFWRDFAGTGATF